MSKISHAVSNSFDSSKSRRLRQQEEEPVDTGLIRCICPSTEDDGFTIQCERCLVWQHAYCVQITHASIPDHYLCDQCSKRKRPKLSKRIPISKKKLRRLDSEDNPSAVNNKKKKLVKSRIVSRYAYPIFKEAKERWSQSTRYKQQQHLDLTGGPLLYDHGPFVTMDATTLLTKGVLIDTPVSNEGLFATRTIPSLRYLMEVTGDVLLKSEFKFDPTNDFVILGTPLSHIMFYPTLDLCIDTRQFGNKARYIRRSCHPNAELRNVVLSRDDKTIHLGLFARHLIEKGQEVTISWNWQRGHIAWKENMNWHYQHKVKQGQDDEGHQVIDEEEERRRKTTIQNMLDRFEKEFGTCACLNKRRCLIEQLHRQIAPQPKEKTAAAFKLPAVNILPAMKPGRRKSSVILLKPKPAIDNKLPDQVSSNQNSRQLIVSPTSSTTVKSKNGAEESVDVDVTSNSPTLDTVKDTSDDELVDVEGDIDIGDDLPVSLDNVKDHLPLLDDNSSEEDDNADLSSLSSLSSLSVFEESGNDVTDDEDNRSKARRKKNSLSRHHKSSRLHHNRPVLTSPTSSSTSSTPVLEKSSPVAPSILPRKKLWMRDYLNKHVTEQAKSLDTIQQTSQSEQVSEPPKIEDQTYTSTETQTPKKEPVSSISNVHSNSDMDVDTKNESVPINEQPSTPIIHLSEETLTETAAPPPREVNKQIIDTKTEDGKAEEHKMDIDVPKESNVFDIDDGELSDASTILLDEEELRTVYKQKPVHQSSSEAAEVSTNNADSSTEASQDNKNVDIATTTSDNTIEVDDPVVVNSEEDVVIDEDIKITEAVSVNKNQSTSVINETATMETEEVAIEVQQDLEKMIDDPAIKKSTIITEETTTTAASSKSPSQEDALVAEIPNIEQKANTADDNDKKPVKKISLQEYLSKQKSIHS